MTVDLEPDVCALFALLSFGRVTIAAAVAIRALPKVSRALV
jgi:hypothetical protein